MDKNIPDLYNYYNLEELQEKEVFSEKICMNKLIRYLKPIKVNNQYYFPKDEVERYIGIKNNSMEAHTLAQIGGWIKSDSIKRIVVKLKEQGIAVDWIPEHPFSTEHALVYGYKEVLNYIKNNTISNFADYYTFEQIKAEHVFKDVLQSVLKRYVKPIKYLGTNYYPKEKIEYYKKLRSESIDALEIVEMAGWSSVEPLKYLLKKLKVEGMQVSIIAKHPFGGRALVIGYQPVVDFIQKNLIINIEEYYTFEEIRQIVYGKMKM